MAAAWDKARFALERKCTCSKGQRFGECAAGWHRVDGHETAREALADAYRMGFDSYRVTDSETGRVLTY